MSKLPVVAAIPNYNMAPQLAELLPDVLAAGYDDVYVLDDASTDDSREVATSISEDIHFVPARENHGAGATRNMIIRALGHDAIIHFMDADNSLETTDTATVVRDTLPSEPFGFMGGLARTGDGYQLALNYGPRQSLHADIGSNLQSHFDRLVRTDVGKAVRFRERFAGFLEDWPDILAEPVRRQVFWVVEQNFVVDSRIFATIGGFDESLREHEIQDLAIRMAARGLKRYFEPAFATTHKNINVRNYNRFLAMVRTEFEIAHKHGFRDWVMPDGQFKPAL